MKVETKKWEVQYDHKDGRAGTVEVTTEIQKLEGFQYGNGKVGCLTELHRESHLSTTYDLRYNRAKDLHMAMLKDYFGEGLVKAEEVR